MRLSRAKKISLTNRKNYANSHGLEWLPSRRGTKLEKKFHDAWSGMHRRCNDEKHSQFKDYGGRGISVCNRWESFPYFFIDMWDSYLLQTRLHGSNISLDRENNDKGYFKKNCRWATKKEQQYNRKNTIRVKGKTLDEWSGRLGVSRKTLYHRLFVYKLSPEVALVKKKLSNGWKGRYNRKHIIITS